jgi:hypothetical protein
VNTRRSRRSASWIRDGRPAHRARELCKSDAPPEILARGTYRRGPAVLDARSETRSQRARSRWLRDGSVVVRAIRRRRDFGSSRARRLVARGR